MKQAGRQWAAVLAAALVLTAWAIRRSPAAQPVEGQADLPEGKLIALTFDDGPRRSTTTRLLDGLAQRGVKATFFLIGRQVEDNAALVRRMDEEGHQIGNHTFDPVQARYVKITVKPEHSMPAWHGGKGSPAFVFIDEISLN